MKKINLTPYFRILFTCAFFFLIGASDYMKGQPYSEPEYESVNKVIAMTHDAYGNKIRGVKYHVRYLNDTHCAEAIILNDLNIKVKAGEKIEIVPVFTGRTFVPSSFTYENNENKNATVLFKEKPYSLVTKKTLPQKEEIFNAPSRNYSL